VLGVCRFLWPREERFKSMEIQSLRLFMFIAMWPHLFRLLPRRRAACPNYTVSRIFLHRFAIAAFLFYLYLKHFVCSLCFLSVARTAENWYVHLNKTVSTVKIVTEAWGLIVFPFSTCSVQREGPWRTLGWHKGFSDVLGKSEGWKEVRDIFVTKSKRIQVH